MADLTRGIRAQASLQILPGGQPLEGLIAVHADDKTIGGNGTTDAPLHAITATPATRVTFVAVGGEMDFTVSGFTAMADATYGLWWAPETVSAVPQLALPNGVGDRTKTSFRVRSATPLFAGDTLVFFLSP